MKGKYSWKEAKKLIATKKYQIERQFSPTGCEFQTPSIIEFRKEVIQRDLKENEIFELDENQRVHLDLIANHRNWTSVAKVKSLTFDLMGFD